MNQTAHVELAIPVSTVDHVRGPANAAITVVEYGDFQCPICRAVEPGVRMTRERFAGKARLIYRHLPIESAHPHALLAAEATEAAAAQGKFWPMHDRLMSSSWGRLARAARTAGSCAIVIAAFGSDLMGLCRRKIAGPRYEHFDPSARGIMKRATGSRYSRRPMVPTELSNRTQLALPRTMTKARRPIRQEFGSTGFNSHVAKTAIGL